MSNTFEVKGEGRNQIFEIGFEGEGPTGETVHVVVSHKPDIPVQEVHFEGAVKLARKRLSKGHPQLVGLNGLRPAAVSLSTKPTLKV